MFGAVAAYVTAEVAAALKRKALLYGVLAGAALVAIFAAGYGLNAIYYVIAFRLGTTTASLIIAGALMMAAASCVAGAYAIGRMPSARPSALDTSSPFLPTPAPYSRAQILSAVAVAVSAIGAGWAAKRYLQRPPDDDVTRRNASEG